MMISPGARALATICSVVGLAALSSPAIAGAHNRARFSDSGLAAGGTSASTASARHHPDPAFAGYLTTGTGRATVESRLTVPKYSCSSQEQAISPGVFLLVGPADHEYFNAANIILGCYKRHKVGEEALVVNNKETDRHKRLYSGDTVLVRATDSPGRSMAFEVRDLTPGHRFTVRAFGPGVASQAELVGDWASVDGDTGTPVPPPYFAPTAFTGALMNGRPLGSLKPTGFDMARSGRIQIATSPLSGPHRSDFTCTRR